MQRAQRGTGRLAKKRATRDEAMAKNKATAGDFILQLVAPYLNAEGDIAKKCGKELDSMIQYDGGHKKPAKKANDWRFLIFFNYQLIN